MFGYMTFFVVLITSLAFLAMKIPKYKQVQLEGGYGYRVVKLPNAIVVFVIAILLMGVSGHRGYSFQDTAEYIHAYNVALFDDINESAVFYKDNWLFWKLSLIIKNISNASPDWYLLIFAIITLGLMIRTFYKYSERFEITIFFFLVFGTYLVTMNAMRQCIASAIMFCGYKFFMNKKWFLFFGLVAIAYFFHPTSVVMIPIYFYCHRPAWQPLATGVIVAAVLALMFVPSFTQSIFSILGDSDYSKYGGASGSNIIRPLIMTAICVFAFVNRKRLHERFPQSDILVNILVVHTVILFASTNSWAIARLTFYTDLYVEMLVPMMMISCFDKKSRSTYVALIMIFFFAYHLYEYRIMDYYSVVLGIH